MARTIALIAGSLTAAAVLALGLAAAGFAPIADPGADAADVTFDQPIGENVSAQPSVGAGTMTTTQILAALDAAGVSADGQVLVVQPDGSVETLDVADETGLSSMDRLLRRMERRLTRTDGS